MDLTETECESVYWIHLTEERVQWRAVVETKVNL